MTPEITVRMYLEWGNIWARTPQFWMNLQSNFDVQVAQEKIGRELKNIKPLTA